LSATDDTLAAELRAVCGERLVLHRPAEADLGAEVASADLLPVAKLLRDAPELQFAMLIDVAGVDYLDYGRSEWQTEQATSSGFSRGVNSAAGHTLRGERRYAVAYQLLSLTHNRRLRLRVWCEGEEDPTVDSLTDVWSSANWFEREAFDLYGILFRGHPDLRRLLTDYGFIGHPFRKDFPLIGNVEVRYDSELKRVVYEPVTIEARTLVPRVIRHDNRYEPALTGAAAANTPGGAGA
jgi:NADH-quinone oxidoreductase subunit C